MALTKYSYTKYVNLSVLEDEVLADVDITTDVDHLDCVADAVDVWFVDAISGPEETALDAVVAAHTNPATPPVVVNICHAGTGAPNSHLGEDGDIYFDPSSLLLYTKAAGTWDSGQLIDDGPDTLPDLTDVTLSSPATGEVLKYDGDDWINNTLAEAGIAAASHTHVEADITDLQAYLTAEVNDLTAAVTWANVPDANVTQTSVTQHQAALSITESQISDFGSYAAASHTHLEADITDLQSYLLDITNDPLSDLSDVTITTIDAGEILKWTGSAWINNTLAEAGVAAASHTHVEADITDLGDYLTGITAEPLGDLSNVVLTSPSSDQVLTFNGSNWVNQAAAGGGGDFGTEYDSAVSAGVSSTTSTTYVQKLRMTTASLPAGDYRIGFYYEQSTDKASLNVACQIHVDDTTVISEQDRQIAVLGQYIVSSGFAEVTLTAATHTIDVDHKTEAGAGGGSNLKNCRIEIWRVA